jgi:TolA-binding protein
MTILALGSLFLAPGGCVTMWRFNDTVAGLETRVKTLEQQKQELASVQQQDRERMETVRKELDDATDALRKGGANLGADLDALKQAVARLKGVDEEHAWALGKSQEDIEAVKKALDSLGAPIVPIPANIGQDRDALLTAAREALAKGDGSQARGLLRRFLETFPDEPRAGEAQFLVGESFFKDGKWGQAVKEYQRVHDRYKDLKGAPIGKALLRIADCLLKQGDCKKAGGVYQYLADLQKKTPEADQAKAALKKLKKTCKGL